MCGKHHIVTLKISVLSLALKMYFDTYVLAKEVDNGITVKGIIDGWENSSKDKRIDYIFTSKNKLSLL